MSNISLTHTHTHTHTITNIYILSKKYQIVNIGLAKRGFLLRNGLSNGLWNRDKRVRTIVTLLR